MSGCRADDICMNQMQNFEKKGTYQKLIGKLFTWLISDLLLPSLLVLALAVNLFMPLIKNTLRLSIEF